MEDLKSIVKVESIREFKNSNRPSETAIRYYISNLTVSAEDFQKSIRLHWGIENKLHWVLDVAFSEDASRKRAGNVAQNFSILSKIALNLLKKETQTKQGIKGKRLKAAYDNNYLSQILGIKVCVCPASFIIFRNFNSINKTVQFLPNFRKQKQQPNHVGEYQSQNHSIRKFNYST